MAEQNLEQSIFLHAIGLASPTDRAAYLDEACWDNPQLRAELAALLAAHDRLGGAAPSSSQPKTTEAFTPPTEAARTVIGPYKLLEPIGEGGMGSVWMAQQTEPVKRLVALKLIKPGMDSKQVVARFEAERQALALMDHPNIARVLDGGTTGTGRPYFVMDLVKGVPITKYCDEHRLTAKERLELFIPVCQAVQHAHQKGIIHRDLKPSNVLVALYDGKPVPKVIDFGVAKAIGQPLTEQTLVTGFGAIVGTLEYMSPEQAEINQLDIDTRSDIYSLGVLLYELLTGTTPLEHKRVQESGLLEALRIIREEEVPTLSKRLSSTAELPAIAANRGTEPAKLTKLVRGELDWIVMKALEKDRNRRYETANALALDVQRYLAGEPVEAAPPSAWYRVSKFLKRHRLAVLTVGLVTGALLLGIIGTSCGLIASERALQTAAEALDQVKDERSKAEEALRQVTLARLGAHRALSSFTDRVILNVLAKQPSLDDAEAHVLKDLIPLWQEALYGWANNEEGRRLFAVGRANLAVLYAELGDLRRATEELGHARRLYEELVRDFPENVEYVARWGQALSNLGALLRMQKQFHQAESLLAQACELLQEAAQRSDDEQYAAWYAKAKSQFAGLLHCTDRLPEANAEWSEARDLYLRLVEKHPDVEEFRGTLAQIRGNLGRSLSLSGAESTSKAEEELLAARDLLLDLLKTRPAHRLYREDLALIRLNLGGSYIMAKRLKEAEVEGLAARELYLRLFETFPAVPEYANGAAGAYVNLAVVALRQQRVSEARRYLEAALPFHRAALEISPNALTYRQYYCNNRLNMAKVSIQEGNYEAVLPITAEMLEYTSNPRKDVLSAAGLLAATAAQLANDTKRDQTQLQELREQCIRQAIRYLHKATEHGFTDVEWVRRSTLFAPLRMRSDFIAWEREASNRPK